MFKTCYNANGLRNLALPAAIRAVGAAGYDAIELSLHPGPLDPFRFTEADAKQVREELAAAGVKARCLATGFDTLLSPERFEPSLIHPTAEGRQRRVDLLRRAIDIALWLGVPVVNFASGLLRPGAQPEPARDLLVAGIEQCLRHAAGRVTLAIEPEPGFLVQTNDEATSLIQRIGSPHFRLNQDIGHAKVCEDDYLASIERALPLTVHIHVEDIKGRRHYHEIPGDGDIDFRAFFAILRRGGYHGYLSVELYNHADVYQTALERSLAHLRACA